MHFTLKTFSELTSTELYEILKLRIDIFCVEQQVLYNDLDNKDQQCHHLIVRENSKIIGALRLVPQGVSYQDAASIGRLVVDQAYRRRGIAEQLMTSAIQTIKTIWQAPKIAISGQLYLKSFYESLGFTAVSDVYLEDTLPHIKLELAL